MNTKSLLDQLFQSGAEMLKNSSSAKSSSNDSNQKSKSDPVFEMKNSSGLADSLTSFMSGKGGAALAGGALGLLIGNKSGRKVGKNVLTYGGIAVLGTLAYKAYQKHQQQSSDSAENPMRTVDSLTSQEANDLSKVILIALIAASKADGHVDERERKLIDAEVTKLTGDESLQAWFDSELKKPLDPVEVARHAATPAMAAEMYLATLLAVDQQNFMEKSYVDELARQLKLASTLKTELEEQAKQAMMATS
jgi:uncharacterized membrane protein YebE (DUF533 family)